MTKRPFAALAFTATLISACGGDDPATSSSAATFQFSVSGALSGAAGGEALFGVDASAGDPVLAIVMTDSASSQTLLLVAPDTLPPAVGSYPFGGGPGAGDSATWTALHIVGSGEQLDGLFVSSAGTLAVESSGAGRLVGSFLFDGRGFFGSGVDSTESIRVSGRFSARRSATIVLPSAATGQGP